MGKLRSSGLSCLLAILCISACVGCSGYGARGSASPLAKVNLTPSVTISINLGATLVFAASAQNAANQSIAIPITFTSSDTSILNVASNGLACAGHWDAAFTSCTPGGAGEVTVTAEAGGVSSPPTLVFVHPAIDNVAATGVLLNNVPIQEPCLSQGQTMTVEAHAFSQGADVTALVGPFTWTANNASVVTITPITRAIVLGGTTFNIPTNQATLTAAAPGLTEIFGSASGASSTSFQQPQFANLQGTLSPVFDFFETCPIQNIVLELNRAGSHQNSFLTSKGNSQTVIATVTDVMGNTSLPNTTGGVVLNKIPLTWTSTQPAAVSAAVSCPLSCTVTTPSPGAAAVTASCSPPTCNVGFPIVPRSLSDPNSLAACVQFLQIQFPNVNSCQQFIPVPVYSSPPVSQPPVPSPQIPSAIVGVVTGTPAASSAVATSMGCSGVPPLDCSTSIYSVSTNGGSPGGEVPMPVPPNSLLFDLAGDRAYLGSDFGAQLLNPANLTSGASAFTPEGSVSGKVLAVSANGNIAIFSDTVHVPNQVYVLNPANFSSPSTPLNISGATAAAFSPDGLKAFIFGFDAAGNPNLYVYSTLQGLQVINLTPGTTVSSIVFAANGAFAYVVEPTLTGVTGPAVSVYNTCNNSVAQDINHVNQVIPLSAVPIKFKVLPDGLQFAALEPGGNIEYFTASISFVTPAALGEPASSICPLTVSHDVRLRKLINFGQTNIHPFDFFTSPDGTLVYLLASDLNSILIFDFATDSPAGGIQLASTQFIPNPTPVTGGITADGSFLLIGGSDSYLHRLSTGIGGTDQLQIQFPSLPNVINPFCTAEPTQGHPCDLNLVAVRP